MIFISFFVTKHRHETYHQASLEKVRVIGLYCCNQFCQQEQGNAGVLGHGSFVTTESIPPTSSKLVSQRLNHFPIAAKCVVGCLFGSWRKQVGVLLSSEHWFLVFALLIPLVVHESRCGKYNAHFLVAQSDLLQDV